MLLEISYPHGGEQQDLPLLRTESFPKSFMDIGGDVLYPSEYLGNIFPNRLEDLEKHETIRFYIKIGFRILDKKCSRIIELSLKLMEKKYRNFVVLYGALIE